MVSHRSSDIVNDQAAEWAVEAAHGEMPPTSRAALEAWLAADTRHRGAFVRARAWLRMTEDVVLKVRAAPDPLGRVSGNDNANEPDEAALGLQWAGRGGWSGRIVGGGAALAACLMVAMMVGMSPFRKPERAVSEKVVHFRDGSTATLGRGAKIEAALSDKSRRITL